jgi:transcriptional regulator with XRE-family HTH domain
MEALAQRIAAAREALGYTQAQLAERVPCNAQTVSNWENGRRQPRYDDLLRLAEVLGRPVSWFLGEPAADEGWRQVGAGLERMRDELERVRGLIDRREPPSAPTFVEPLVPLAGRVGVGPVSEVLRGPCGWVQLSAAQCAGVAILRLEGDAHYPLLRDGDLLGFRPASGAAPGEMVTARLASGLEVCKRLGLDGSLESVNASYPPMAGEVTITGRLAWVWRDVEGREDPAAEAARRAEWLAAAEAEVAEVEARIERGDGQWQELQALCERIRDEAERLRPVYGSAVVRPAALAMGRTARALGERGHYGEALVAARAAEEAYASLERVGDRGRDALNNLYNVSQLALFTGDVDLALSAAAQAAECADWVVRWKALKNLDEIRVNYRAESVGEDVGRELLHLAEVHRAEDAVQADLASSVAHEIRGNAAFVRGDVAAARAAAERQVAAAESAGLPYRIANAWLDVAQYALVDGDAAAAAPALARVAELTAAQDLGDLEAMRAAHQATLEALGGDLARARTTLFAALRQAAAVGSPRAGLMAELAGLELARGAGDEAAFADHLAAAREVVRKTGLFGYEQVLTRMAERAR